MTINHNDPDVRRMFEIELAGGAAVVPDCIRSQYDRDYMIGILSARARAHPAPYDLAARFTTTIDNQGAMRVQPPAGHVDADPRVVEHAKVIAYLAARVRARTPRSRS